MSKSYVSVQYESKEEPGKFGGKPYTYIAGIELAVGDLVVAPVGKSETKAQVSAINVPESKIDERVMPHLKTIEKLYESEGESCQQAQQ
jgi:hypothetical protein